MASSRKGFLLRVPPELLDELRALAEQEMRSVNAQIEWMLRDTLRRHGRRGERRGKSPRPPESGGGRGD